MFCRYCWCLSVEKLSAVDVVCDEHFVDVVRQPRPWSTYWCCLSAHLSWPHMCVVLSVLLPLVFPHSETSNRRVYVCFPRTSRMCFHGLWQLYQTDRWRVTSDKLTSVHVTRLISMQVADVRAYTWFPRCFGERSQRGNRCTSTGEHPQHTTLFLELFSHNGTLLMIMSVWKIYCSTVVNIVKYHVAREGV